MPTVTQHAQNIVALASQADALIARLRPIIDDIQAEENALHLEAIKNGPYVTDGLSGRRGLRNYAKESLTSMEDRVTVTQLATKAWAEFLQGAK